MLNWNKDYGKIHQTRNSPGSGNVVMIEIGSAEVMGTFSAFRQIGVSVEKVASIAARVLFELLESRQQLRIVRVIDVLREKDAPPIE
jgi:hypothetical protein